MPTLKKLALLEVGQKGNYLFVVIQLAHLTNIDQSMLLSYLQSHGCIIMDEYKHLLIVVIENKIMVYII